MKTQKILKDKIIRNTCVKQRKSHPKTKNKPSVDVGPFDKKSNFTLFILGGLKKEELQLIK